MELVMKCSSPTADHHTRATRRLLCPHTHTCIVMTQVLVSVKSTCTCEEYRSSPVNHFRQGGKIFTTYFNIQILWMIPTVHLCISCDPRNKQ